MRVLVLLVLCLPAWCFAQTTGTTTTETILQWFQEVLSMIQNFGGLAWYLRLAAILTIVISSMKVTFLNNLIWNRLGNFKAWAAPILALVVGLITLCTGGSFSWPSLFAYLSTGLGAIAIHELLDTIKAIPGIGSTWLYVINLIESIPVVGSGSDAGKSLTSRS